MAERNGRERQPMTAAIYARVSTTRQADNELSIPDQLKQLQAWCAANGFDVAAVFVEPGASATDDRRPEFQRMIAEATASPYPFTAIVVHSRSRFFRDLREFLNYEVILKRAGAKVISITQQTSEDAPGEMASKLFSLFDEYQSKENAKHTRRAMQENARQGNWNGSKPPYGYRAVPTGQAGSRGRIKKRLEIDPAEAEIVVQLFDLYLRGRNGQPMGMKAIAAFLNERAITMRGRCWRIQKVNDILADPLYIGRFYYNQRDSRTRKLRPESEWIEVEIPAILADDVFDRVAKRRADSDPRMHAPRAIASPAPLVGLLKCGHCGAPMIQATGKSGRYRYYKCATRIAKQVDACDCRNLPRDITDQLVLEAIARGKCSRRNGCD
jgi:site-specific DNA recombinase